MNRFNCILQIENEDFELIVYYEYEPPEPCYGMKESFSFYELKTLEGIDCDWLLTDGICESIVEQIKECKDD